MFSSQQQQQQPAVYAPPPPECASCGCDPCQCDNIPPDHYSGKPCNEAHVTVCTTSMVCNMCHLDLAHCLCKRSASCCHTCGFNPCRCADMPAVCSSCGTMPCSCIRQNMDQQAAPVGAPIGSHYDNPGSYDPAAYAAFVERQRQMMMMQHQQPQEQQQQPQAMPMSEDQAKQMVSAISQRINPLDPQQRVTKRLHIIITGSLKEADSNPKNMRWQLLSNETLSKAPVNSDYPMRRIGDLSNCVLAYASILKAQTNHFPDIGVQIAHMSGNTYTAFNNRFPYVIFGGGQLELWESKGVPIYVNKKIIGTVFFSNYAGLTEKSVMDRVEIDTNLGIALVPPGNIIMFLLFLNSWRLPIPPENFPKYENKFVLHINLFKELREFAIEKVIKKLPYVDLSNKSFFVQLWRADVSLDEPQHFITEKGMLRAISHSKELMRQFVEIPKTTHIWMEMSYMILGASRVEQPSSAGFVRG